MEIHLIVKDPSGKTSHHILKKDENIIGREEDVDLQLNDPNVSAKHARIYFKDGIVWCEDGYNGNPSKNGTWLNNVRITQPIPLEKGDQLFIGRCGILVKDILLPLHLSHTEELDILQGKDSLTLSDFQKLQLAKIDEEIKKQRIKIGIGVILLIFLIGLTFSIFFFKEPIPVKVYIVTKKIGPKLKFITFALPGRNYVLDSPFKGKIIEIYKKIGDKVAVNDPILKFDDSEIKNKIFQIKKKIEILKLQIEKIKNKYSLLKKKINNLKSKLAKYKKEKKIKNYKSTKNKLKESYYQLNIYLKNISVYKRNKEILEKELNTYLWKLDLLVIKSPLKGYIKDISVVKGAYVNEGKPLCRIIDISTIKLFLRVPENKFPNWYINKKIKIYFNKFPFSTFIGKIISITFRSESGYPVFEIIIDVKNKNEKIKPGMKAFIKYEKKPKIGFFIPRKALVRRKRNFYVFKVKKEIGVLVPVKIEQIEEIKEFVLVKQGLKEDDIIVLSPKGLKEGQKVKIKY